ncbi:hypothetical protein AWB71_04311 [Caballeronia peredens]|nr:hypothetical protein AWB71_04311 [Caballeronia peredens]
MQSGDHTAPQLGTANHHVVTYQDGAYCLYLNGVLLASAKSANVTIQPVLQIGSTGWTCGAFDGVIGEVALYDKALDADRVRVHHLVGLS